MTPEERAKELGVKVIPVHKPIHKPKIIPLGDKSEYLKSVPIVAVCGGCCREIRQNERIEPCGREDCPFGMLSLAGY
jgi:hypothetical protein